MSENIIEINKQPLTPEQKSENYPSDYFECLKSVYQISREESNKRSSQHFKSFKENHDIKEFITVLLIHARIELKEKYGFSELTTLEIKSLVDISKRLSEQLSDEKSIKNFLDFHMGYGKFDIRNEVTDNWLIENYGIHPGSYGDINTTLFEEERKSGTHLEGALNNFQARNKQFVDYVRKIRDKAMLAERKK